MTTGRRGGDAAVAPHVAAARGAAGHGQPAEAREINEAAEGGGKIETSTTLVSAVNQQDPFDEWFHFNEMI